MILLIKQHEDFSIRVHITELRVVQTVKVFHFNWLRT